MLTVGRVFLHDLHSPNDAGLLAVGVVEKSQVTLLHRSQIVACHIVADSCELLDLLQWRT